MRPSVFERCSRAGNAAPRRRFLTACAPLIRTACASLIPAACAALLLATVICTATTPAFAEPRIVRVGVYENEPKVFTDDEGKPTGIFIDLIEAMAKEEGWTIQYVPVTWEEGLQALEDWRIDLMPDVAYSEARDRVLDFHKTPVVESWSYVYAAPGMRIDRISQLDGRRVAVLKGSIQETVFTQMAEGFGYDVEIVPVDSLKEAFHLASTGETDAAIANYLFGDYFYHQYGLVKTPIVFNAVPLFYATTQGRNADLLQAIDRHLNTWIAEPGSVYYTTLGGYFASMPETGLPPYVGWILGAVGAALAAAVGMIALLRWRVRQQTSHLLRANRELEDAYDSTLEGWSRALDMRDRETQGQTGRVTDLAVELARRMRVPEDELLHLRQGALLHDIGKLGVPDSILLKPSALDDDEWNVMRRHPQSAYDMLSAVDHLMPSLDVPYCHHERWDGTGYPQGLAGDAIPLTARIFAIADVWDALLSDRPYRRAWARADALDHIARESGKHFDPKVVEAFMAMITEVEMRAGD